MKILLVAAISLILFYRGHAANPRSINLNLDTSFVLDNDDQNMTLLEKVKKIFDKIKQFFETLTVKEIVTEKKEKIEEDGQDGQDKQFLKKFFNNIGNTALEYNNNMLKNLAKSVANEISTIVDQNEEFSDIDFKKSVDRKMKRLSSMKAKKIKSTIKKALQSKSESVKNFERKICDFYNEKDERKLKRLTMRFEDKPESRKKLKKVVKDTFSVLFYEKYDELDKKDKKLFTKEIKDLLHYIELDVDTRRSNDKSSNSEELEINTDNITGDRERTKEPNQLVFKKDIKIVVKERNKEEDKE